MNYLSTLFPIPRKAAQLPGHWIVPEKGFAAFEGERDDVNPASRRIMRCFVTGWRPLEDRKSLPAIRFRILPPPEAEAPDTPKAQSYRLRIFPTGVLAEAPDKAGLFYAAVTLAHLIDKANGKPVPCCDIEDWPDFPVRGVMLDISRDKVPSRTTLVRLIDQLANLKFNHFQLYMEHTFAYGRHQRISYNATPLPAREIRFLDEYCANRCIEFVPNQNSFGHMERWLAHPHYAHLAELPQGGAPLPWGGVQEYPSALCPTDPRTFEFLAGLYDELLRNFTSRTFNVGCDEVFDLLGNGRSHQQVKKHGVGRVYLDYLLRLHQMVSERGFRMAFWGDMVMSHPRLLPKVPKDALVLEWGYEADHPFNARCKKLAAAGLPFYVCPGTSSWNSLSGRTDNMFANLLSAAKNGMKHGAGGYIVCDWGDWGHWHPLALSYPGFTCAAGLSWCIKTNRKAPWAAAADTHFADGFGKLLFDLGDLYRLCGATRANGTELFHILSKPLTRPIAPEVTPENLRRICARLDELIAPIPDDDDIYSTILTQELRHVISLVRMACHKGLAMLDGTIAEPAVRKALRNEMNELIDSHHFVWLERNTKGGLDDSTKRFERIRDELG